MNKKIPNYSKVELLFDPRVTEDLELKGSLIGENTDIKLRQLYIVKFNDIANF